MYIDIERSYDTALEWKVTGNTAYADQTVNFLNAWSSTMTALTGDADRFLASGLYGFQWANIAEIMRTYSGWAAADQTKFANYLTGIYLPMNQDFLANHNTAYITNYWANWDLCNLASEMAIGIYTDNHALYQDALTYIYGGGGNGAWDKAIYYIHAGNLGQGQEEGRDQGHSNLDFALIGEICQMAWNQGDDLFSYNNNEMLAGVEYLAKYNLGYDVPYENYEWGTGQSGTWSQQAGGASPDSRGELRPIFELFYNHYVNLEGLSAPYTAQALAQTRPEGDYGNGDEYSWGTLTFALDPITTPQAPQDLVAYEKGTGNVQLDWWGGANDVSYNVYRSTGTNGTYTLIAGDITGATTYTDTNLPAGTYSYKVTGVSGTTETAASNVAQATGSTQLVAQLQFNDGTGTTASDAVPGGPTGTLNGGATWAAGKSGGAVSLDGTSGYVSLPSNVLAGVSDFTISAWVYLNGNTAWSRVFDFGNSTGNWMYLTTQNASGQVEFATSTTYGYNKQAVDGTAPLPTGKWTNVAVTFSNRLATIYVNGVAVGSNANMDFPPYEIQQMTNMWIGRSQFSTDPYLNGKVDDFRIYRGAMPAGQVYTLATGKSAPAAPAAPSTLAATAVAGNTINLTWAAVRGATSYAVLRSPTSGGPYVPIATLVSGTTYADTGLTAGTTYYYVVDAANNGGDGNPSIQAGATALPPLPSVPTGLSSLTTSPTSVSLNWTAAANDATYTVRRAATSGGPYTTIATGVTATTYTDAGLTTGTTYYYVVAADNTAGESANSTQASATPSSLYLDLSFDEGTGTTAADSSGNGWNATLVNGATWTTGVAGSAINLAAASSQYVSLPTGVVNPLAACTIATWVEPTSISNWMRIFDFGSSTSDYMFLTPSNGNNSTLRFAINTGSGEQQINSTATLTPNTWTHLAVTLSGGVGILYVNGTEVGRNSSMTLNPAALGATTHNYIGRSQFSADPYFNGSVDDFRIYSVALTAAEVAALSQGAAPPAIMIRVSDGSPQISPATSLTLQSPMPPLPSALLKNGLSGTTPDGDSIHLIPFGSANVYVSIANGAYDLPPHPSLSQSLDGQPMTMDAMYAIQRLYDNINGDDSINNIGNFPFRNRFSTRLVY